MTSVGAAPKPIKVVHVLAPVAFGGGESLLITILRATQPGLHQSVITIGFSPQLKDALNSIGVECETMVDGNATAERPREQRLQRLPRELGGIPRLRRLLATTKPDVMHTHGFPPSLLGALTPNNIARAYTHHYERQPPNPVERAVFTHFVFRRYQLLTTPSEHLTSSMNLLFPDLTSSFVTVPNCIDDAFFRPADSKQWRRRLGIGNTIPLLVAVGRLVPVKNHASLIEAMSVPAGPLAATAHLAIAGDGPEEARLRHLILEHNLSSRVHLLGALGRTDIRLLLAAATAVVHPSTSEGMSLATLEALAAGQPILALQIPSMSEVIGDAGVLVPPSGLAAGMEELLQSAEGLRSEARRRAEYHRSERVAAKWSELYRNLLVRGLSTPGQ